MGKEGLWQVIQIVEGHQTLAPVEGRCKLGLSAMEVCEWVAGRNTCAAGVAYGSHHTINPV